MVVHCAQSVSWVDNLALYEACEFIWLMAMVTDTSFSHGDLRFTTHVRTFPKPYARINRARFGLCVVFHATLRGRKSHAFEVQIDTPSHGGRLRWRWRWQLPSRSACPERSRRYSIFSIKVCVCSCVFACIDVIKYEVLSNYFARAQLKRRRGAWRFQSRHSKIYTALCSPTEQNLQKTYWYTRLIIKSCQHAAVHKTQ